MEVLKSGDAPALVSNMEVMQLLRERMAAREEQEQANISSSTAANGEDSTAAAAVIGSVRKGPFQNRDWMEQTVLAHLQSSPAGGADVKVDEMPELVARLRRAPAHGTAASTDGSGQQSLSGYGLTNAETLQILNHMPTSLVELHLLIEDIEKREALDDEEKQTDFLKLISEFSGRPVETGGDGEEDEDGDGEGEES